MSIKPYYQDEQVVLYHGDFRDLLPAVLEVHGTPDLAVVDPPYGETTLAWDTWPAGWPSLIPGSAMWCFGSMRMFLDHAAEFSGWKLSQDIVWEKHNGSGFSNDRFKRVHEFALHWYRGDWAKVRHETPRVPAPIGTPPVAGIRKGQSPHTGTIAPQDYNDDGHRLVRSVIRARSMHGSAINPTEKPAGLVENLIAYGCPPGGLVLDVFAGGCSSLVAARNSGRRAVGIELREEQCAAAVEHRLSQAVLPFGEAS